MQLNPNDPRLIIGIVALVVIIAVVVAVIAYQRKKKAEHLRTRFGSEYDRTVLERGFQKPVARLLVYSTLLSRFA